MQKPTTTVPMADTAEVQGHAASILKSASIQTRIPGIEEDIDTADTQREPGLMARAFSWLLAKVWFWRVMAHILGVLQWVGLGAGAAFLLYCLVTFAAEGRLVWKKRGHDKNADAAAASYVPATVTPALKWDELAAMADALAREGKFADAMHTLLLSVLAALRRSDERSVSDAFTSRELLAWLSLPDGLTLDLKRLVMNVERAYFGGQAAGSQDYTVCRDMFAGLIRRLEPSAS